MRLPAPLARLALPWVVAKVAVEREWAMGADGRAALGALRAAGEALEWEVHTVAAAIAKLRGRPFLDAIVGVRLGLVAGWAEGTLPLRPTRPQLMRAAWRGAAYAERRWR